jgi:hypothetical protein
MIYIEEKDFDRQLELLTFLTDKGTYTVCAWLYPEATSPAIAGYAIDQTPSGLQPVTTYYDGDKAKCTTPVPATKENLQAFFSDHSSFKNNCDSLALYKTTEHDWSVAIVGHEGMCLIKDDYLLNDLANSGYDASLEAPSWW